MLKSHKKCEESNYGNGINLEHSHCNNLQLPDKGIYGENHCGYCRKRGKKTGKIARDILEIMMKMEEGKR